MGMWTHDREKAVTYNPVRHLSIAKWYETKFDGIRMTFFKQADGKLLAFGRKVESHLEFMSKLAAAEGRDWLWTIRDNIPPLSSVDGELVFGRTCTDVITGINEKNPHLTFYPFAMPYFDNKWMGHQPIEVVDAMLKKIGLHPPIRAPFKPDFDFAKHRELLQCEGFVLKGGHYHSWFKYKVAKTVDAIVMEWKPGTGKYEGMMGSLIVGVYKDGTLTELSNVGTGFDDEERDEITADVVGRVVEVEYQAVATQGRLQHPRFLRFRDDKPVNECVWGQLDK